MNGKLEPLDKQALVELIDDLDRSIAGRNLMIERPADFWQRLLDIAYQLIGKLGPKIHSDPNVNCMWGIALICAAWVGCIPKSKLYSPPEERPELTDGQRREISKWLEELQLSISSIYLAGYELAGLLRERRQEPNYTSWETSA